MCVAYTAENEAGNHNMGRNAAKRSGEMSESFIAPGK